MQDLCALLSVLDDRGKREAILIESLEKRQAFLCQGMSNKIVKSAGTRHLTQSDQSELDMVREDSCSPVSDVDNLSLTETIKDSLPSSGAVVLDVGNKGEEQQERWNRLQEFDSWIWNSFYSNLNAVKHGKRSYLDSLARCESCHDLYWRDEKHCRICHTTFELDFDLEERYAIHAATCRENEDSEILFPQHKVLSSQIQSLKAAIHAIEVGFICLLALCVCVCVCVHVKLTCSAKELGNILGGGVLLHSGVAMTRPWCFLGILYFVWA